MPRRNRFVSFIGSAHATRPQRSARRRTSLAMPPPSEATPLLPNNNRAPARNDAIRWRETASFVLPYIVPETTKLKLIAALSVFCVLAKQGSALLTPYAFKLAVDTLTNNLLPGGGFVVPYFAIALYVVSQIASTLFGGVQGYTYSIVAATCTRRFSVAMFTHLQNLSLAFHLSRRTGEVTRIMDRGSSSIESVVNTVVFTLFPTIIEALVVTAIFFKLGTPWIAVTTLTTVIAYFVFTFMITNWRIKYRRDLIEADNKLSEQAVDTLINYETVKMFGMEQEEASTYATLQKSFQDIYIWFRLTLSAINLGQAAIKSMGLGSAMLLAAIAAAHGTLTPGDFVLINGYVGQLFGPLFFLGSTYRMLTQAATDLEKCVNLLSEPITVQDEANAKPFEAEEKALEERRIGDVKFDNVSFKYHGTERGSSGGLRNISFHVAPGRMVAFVGASGAGKSTIIRLLLRFYDVDSGSVLIDGENVKNYSQESLRKNIGVVAQDTILFNRSLRFNISYGKPDAPDAEIYDAARSAALGDFVDSLPLKLDTIVGERGVRLSGGERQRVGCARCLIKAPAIVLLDEASSSLDTQTEREMQANLREVCKNRTTIVIAHRLSTIMMADEIIVLGTDGVEEGLGTVVERGTHAELLQQKGSYAEMWDLQTSFDNGELSEVSEVKDLKN